jgi:protein-tyrosine phosphatase
MQAAAGARGYDLSDLRARQLDARDFDRFDLIIGMDRQNIEDIEALRPEGNTTPVRSFTEFAPDGGLNHVPDPYYTRDFDGALNIIEAAAAGLKAHLSRA